jgi:hypothetical protein
VTEPSVLICTPIHGGSHITGSVNVSHHHVIAGLIRDTHFNLAPASFGGDLVRARSRLVRQFLLDTPCTHLLFLDSDVTFPGGVPQAGRLIRRLVESGKPIVAATYPLKRVRWERVKAAVLAGKDPESAFEYPLHLAEDTRVVGGCLPVDGVPTGCCMMTRECLELMTEHYAPSLTFDDVVDGKSTPTVAIFQLVIGKGANGARDLLGEDYSVCFRARAIGLQPWLYVGPDSALTHVGMMAFTGREMGPAQ